MRTLRSVGHILERAMTMAPPKCGIYFLISAGEIVYVGRANDAERRVWEHLQAGKTFDSWSWIVCAPDEQVALERAYLDALLPCLNLDPVTAAARKALHPHVEDMQAMTPRIRAGKPCPKGCYWRGGTLWARAMVAGVDRRCSLRTASPKEAVLRRQAWMLEMRSSALKPARTRHSRNPERSIRDDLT